MLNSIIQGTEITTTVFIICTGVSIALGILTALLCMYKSKYSQSFVITLAMIPMMVQLVIMLVNGNLGAGVAVAGAFSLVRFRSAQGTAREIALIFLAMALGLATGMGYISLAVIFFAAAALLMVILHAVNFGGSSNADRTLTILVPEDLDYENLFNDILDKYTSFYELETVKTAKMGALYSLHYKINLKNANSTKAMIDALRCRNGNLEITCGRPVQTAAL